jgi:hypothetical protein
MKTSSKGIFQMMQETPPVTLRESRATNPSELIDEIRDMVFDPEGQKAAIVATIGNDTYCALHNGTLLVNDVPATEEQRKRFGEYVVDPLINRYMTR